MLLFWNRRSLVPFTVLAFCMLCRRQAFVRSFVVRSTKAISTGSATAALMTNNEASTSSSTGNAAATEQSVCPAPNILKDLPKPLVLGSGSATRRQILQSMGVDHVVVVRSIDERQIGTIERQSATTAPGLVELLARAKMAHLLKEIMAGRCDEDLPVTTITPTKHEANPPASSTTTSDGTNYTNEYIILTSDQVVTCDGAILEQPDSVDQARSFVARYGTHPCTTVGCAVLTHVPSGTQCQRAYQATVHFLSTLGEGTNADALVDALLEEGAPVLKCAGGLMVEHPLVQAYVERVEGTQDSVMGLCSDAVRELLEEMREKLQSQLD